MRPSRRAFPSGSAAVAAAEKALGAVGVKSADGVVVPPAEGNGTMLAFVGA